MADSRRNRRATVGEGKRVTINDVADRLGMAKGTVSRALNGYADIAENTRRKVERTARRMGYVPLASAQSIRTGRCRAIGLVLEQDAHDQHSPFLTDFLAGISREASREGWTLTVASASYGQDLRDTAGRLVEQQKADGFILPRTRVEDDRIDFLETSGTPFILYGRTRFGQSDSAPCSWYDINGEGAMRTAVVQLAKLGHSRIAYVGYDQQFNFSLLRYQGYLSGLEEAHLPHDPNLCRFECMTTEDGATAVEDLLRLNLPPTAIVFATDEAAFGAFAVARARKLRIGQQLSVLSYDGLPRGQYSDPPLSSFHVDNRKAGETLARLLIRQVRGEPAETLTRLDEAVLKQRGSSGPPTLTSTDLARYLADT